jgi:signal transduction histidine kinase
MKKTGFSIFGKSRDKGDLARMEAFLDGFPGDYCGWGPEGTLAFSNGFCSLFGLSDIRNITDLQSALSPSDAAVLEGMFARLQESGAAFAITVKTAESACFIRLTGRRGQDSAAEQKYDILWAEDITAFYDDNEKLARGRLAAEEERDKAQAALDTLALPLWMRNLRTDIVWCNRAYAQLLDTSSATVIAEQKELPAKAAGKKIAAGRALAQDVLDKGSAASVLSHIVTGGSRRLMNITEIPLSASGMTLGMAQDVTREEILETEQKRHSAANKELLEQLGTAIGIFDVEQKLEFYNSAFAQLWDLEDQYLNGKPKLGDIMEKLREARRLPEQADFRKFKQGWLNMFTGLLAPHEDMLYLPDGRALRMLAMPHSMGGLMMTFEDVTSRLELESSYNTLIAVQKETLDNLAEGVAVFGGDGRLKLWNPSFARLWKLHPEDLAGEPHMNRVTEKMKALFLPEDWPVRQRQIAAQGIDRKAQAGRIERGDGSLIMYSTMPLPDGGVLVTHVDITDTVRVENALREKNAALEAAERLKLDFLANVSYQLRTPLNAIMGFAEILGNEYFGKLNERQGEYTSGIQEAGERLLSLIDDILDLATIEAGYLKLNRDRVSVRAIMEGIYNLTADWARKERVDVKLDCADDAGVMMADERRLKQALLNLVRNAITHTAEGGVITLEARRGSESVNLAVRDTGPGIRKEDRERIFEPFERAQAGAALAGAVKNHRGAGLGLSLVKNIVELHGGHIVVDENTDGRGAAFIVSLPLDSGMKEQDSPAVSGKGKLRVV